MNKDIKLLIENIFQRENARELLKRSKAEELDAQIRKMYLYHPKTKDELIDNVIECLENKTDLNLIDVSDITDFTLLFYSKINRYIQIHDIKSIDISGWYIRSDANVKDMFQYSILEEIVLPNNLQKIDNEMFWRSNLKSVTIPNSVTSIGVEAFLGCIGLTSLDIPDSVNSIGAGAFWGCSDLTSVNIPNKLTSISERAFSGCSSLKSVNIPGSVNSIGNNAFSYCTGLTSVNIPDSGISIGEGAFDGCGGLTSVTIPNSVTSIGKWAFYNTPWFNNQPDGLVYAGLVACCYKGTIPDGTSVVIDDGTRGIACSCFSYRSGLTSVTIPDSVTTIGEGAFEGCYDLTSVTIPNSVTSISDKAFYKCPNLTIYVNNVTEFKSKFNNYRKFCKAYQIKSIRNKPINENIFQREGARELLKRSKAEELDVQIRKMYLYHPKDTDELEDNVIECLENKTNLISIDVSEITKFSFYGKISEYIKNNKIKQIDISGWDINPNASVEYMFQFSTLEEIVLPNNLQKIEVCMFYKSSLTKITIPNSVTSIGDSAFASCSGLTSIDIPDSVNSIGDYAFASCSGLTSITIPDSVTKIGNNAFYNTPWLNTQPDGLVYAGLVAYKYKGKMPDGTSIVIKDGKRGIAGGCFSYRSGLTSVTIPNSVTSIGHEAFSCCSGLTSVTIPDSVTSIGIGAFADCSDLTSVTIPNSVKSIGYGAFSNCPKLKIYVNNVAKFKSEIENYREFCKASQIKSIKNKPINENIFQRENARELLKKSKAEELDAQIRKMYLYHPETKEELEDNIIECLKNKTDLNWIDVSEIDDFEALFNCFSKIGRYIQKQNITSIDISGWYIRSDANIKQMFKWSTLEEIVLPNNLQKIDNDMFWLSLLKSVFIPVSVTSIGEQAFYGCKSLSSVTIPVSVTSIGEWAFYGCRRLKSVTIPKSDIYIGEDAFTNCPKLTIYVNNVDEFKNNYREFCKAKQIKSIRNKPINENTILVDIDVDNVDEFKRKFKKYFSRETQSSINRVDNCSIELIPISKELIQYYKSSYNLLRHVDPNDLGYMIIDKVRDNLIGYVAWNKNIITALEVIKDFQGKGYSKILLKIAEANNCNELTVNKNNKKAISIYEHLGWKFYKSLGSKMLIYQKPEITRPYPCLIRNKNQFIIYFN